MYKLILDLFEASVIFEVLSLCLLTHSLLPRWRRLARDQKIPFSRDSKSYHSLYNLTVFCKKSDRIKGCVEKISFSFDFSKIGSGRKDDKVRPPAPQLR